MNIAVIGGGKRCAQLLLLIEQHQYKEVNPKIVAVADIDENAPGFVLAKEKGLFTTVDYNDFFKREEINMIIELTGSMDIYNDILKKKRHSVRAISTATAKLFWEIARVSTMQKKTNQELYETRALYKTMINQLIQEDVLVIGCDYRIMDVSNTILNRLGLKKEEVIGKHCYEITHRQSFPCNGEKHPCPLIKTMESLEPSQTTHIHFDKDHRKVYYSISTYPLMEDGDIIGVVELSRDITKDIDTQKAMMQQEKLASIGRLSAGVAHEINNPLTTILTTAMLLQEDMKTDDPIYAELETIAKESLRCRRIVTSLLDFAKQSRPVKKANDINNIVADSILLTKKQAAFKDIAIREELDSDLPWIYVDKGQLQQALINLILNAVESIDAGGTITIQTKNAEQSQEVEIVVMDTGEGIANEVVDKIFDPFFTTKDDGNGLGLAITLGIIEQHGGTINVTSERRGGTTFVIKIPIYKGDGHDS